MRFYTIGVDIGFRNTGVVVFEHKGDVATKIKFVEAFVITTTKTAKVPVVESDVLSTLKIAGELNNVIKHYSSGGKNIVVLSVELPHGGGKSSRALRTMSMCSSIIPVIVNTINAHVEKINVFGLYVTPSDVKFVYSGRRVKVSKEQVIAVACALLDKYNVKYKREKDFEHIADAMGALLYAIKNLDEYKEIFTMWRKTK